MGNLFSLTESFKFILNRVEFDDSQCLYLELECFDKCFDS